jgi:hypothetical protein
MTPADEEAHFIELWNQSVETAEIARQLGLKATTAQSRARRLQERGLIQPRPRGGNYPSLRQREREEGGARVPEQTPRVSKRVSRRVPDGVPDGVPVDVLPTVPPAANSPDMTPLLHEILQELRTLTQGLAGRVSDATPRVSPSTPQASSRVSQGVSLGPRDKTERWNLHLPRDLIAQTKDKAKALGVHPSELVAEVLRRWLAEDT